MDWLAIVRHDSGREALATERRLIDRKRGRAGQHGLEDARATERLDDCHAGSDAAMQSDARLSSMPSVPAPPITCIETGSCSVRFDIGENQDT